MKYEKLKSKKAKKLFILLKSLIIIYLLTTENSLITNI